MNTIKRQPSPSAHPHAVNLGLPSLTKWASCNVDASCPEDYGGYYSWGETQEKKLYERRTFSLYDISKKTFITLDESICGTEHDVARHLWGDRWQMPTLGQFKELVEYCSYEWTILNGVIGGKFTGPNGNSIFLPAAGRRYGPGLYYDGLVGLYWSGEMCPGFNDGAYGLDFNEIEAGTHNYCDNYLGHPIRPVVAR